MSAKYGRIVNDFFHDLAAGFFPGAVVGAWVIERNVSPGNGRVLGTQAVGSVWMLLVLGLIVSVGTGLYRMRYRLAFVKPELAKARNDTAFAKHVAFILMLAAAGIVFGMFVA